MRGLLPVVSFMLAFRLDAGVVLADKGKSDYRLVVATNATLAERYAAEELRGYLEKISGVKLPIVTDDERAGSREILLGDNSHLRRLGEGIDAKKLGTDGFHLRTTGHSLIIAGGKPRGTL